jgi:WD40 repeat protein
MAAMLADHPGWEDLQAYGQGRLAPEAALALEQHLAGCSTCCELLEKAPGDSFLSRLRDAGSTPPGGPGHATTADGGDSVRQAPAVPPELVDHPRYRVLGLVGQGGMGAVYRAEHRHMERLVALKVINPGLVRNPSAVQRFRQEVRAAARLHHPNIVTAHDADQAGGLHFLVMEYVEGTGLADLVRERGPLPVAEACEYVRQAALGLQHAHEQGMVHRDLKPQNLMRTPAGQVKILDFGLARLPRTSEEPSTGEAPAGPLTGAGTVMGTADYIAPEQAADPRAADIRADIYALGCTLFHLLAGRPPFPDGSVPEKIAHHAGTPLPSLNAVRPEVPTGLAAVVARMTAKDPAGRHATPAEVAEALAPFADSGRLRASSGRLRSRLAGRKRRLLAAAVVLLAVGAVVASVLVLRLRTGRGEVVIETDDPSLELTVRDNGEIVRIRDPKSGQAWDVDTKNYQIAAADRPAGLAVELPGRGKVTLRRKGGGTVTVTTTSIEIVGQAPWWQGILPYIEKPYLPVYVCPSDPVRVPTAEELARRPNAADALKHKGLPEVARAYVGGGDPKRVPPELVGVLGDVRFRCSGGQGPMAFSADGKQIAVADGRDTIRFLDARTGRFIRQITSPHAPRDRMAFSPDGRHLAGTRHGQFGVLDAQTGRLIWKLTDTRMSSVEVFAFGSDGKTIGLSGKAPTAVTVVELRDATTGKLAYSLVTGLEGAIDFALSPDLQRLVCICRDLGAVTYSNRSAPGKRRLGIQGIRVAFSPDGKHFAVLWKSDTPTGRKVTIHDADGKTLHTLSGPKGGVEPEGELLAFSPDGKTLIAVSNISNCIRWDVAQGKKLSSAQLPRKYRTHFNVLSPDGKVVARRSVLSRQIDLFDTETGKPLYSRVGHEGAVAALAFSPDGKYLASSDPFATTLWDLATGRAVATRFERAVHHLTFSPDGRLLAGADTGSIAVFRVADGTKLHWLDAKTSRVDSIAFHPDGSLIAAACGDYVRVWRTDDGKEVRILGKQNHVFSVSFSPDGSHILAAGDGIRIWETRTGLEVKHVKGSRYYLLEWLAAGKTLAATHTEGWDERGYVLHVDPASGKILKRLPAPIPYPRADLRMFPHALSPRARLLCLCEEGGFRLMQPFADPARRQTFRLAPSGSGFSLPTAGGFGDRTAAFSPDGRYLACGNAEGVISLLRLSERGKVPELPVAAPTDGELAGRPNAADALKPGDISEVVRAYVGGGDPKKAPPDLVAVLGDVRFRCPGGAGRPAFSPDGERLAVPSQKAVLLFDAGSGRLVRSVEVPWVTTKDHVAFSPNGRALGVGSWGQHFRLLDVGTGRVLWTREDKQLPYVDAFAFSADGKAVGFGSSLEVRDAATGMQLHSWFGPGKTIWSFAFHASPFRFATVAEGAEAPRAVGLWSPDVPHGGYFAHLAQGGERVAFSFDGKWLAVAQKNDKLHVSAVDLCHADDHFRKARHHLPLAASEVLTFTRGGKGLITGARVGENAVIGRWDAATGKFSTTTVPLPGEAAAAWTVSPDGRVLAVAVPDEPVVRLVDLETGRPRFPDRGRTRPLRALAFSPDGKLLASSDGGTVRVWDLATARFVHTWRVPGAFRLAFSPDGKALAAAGRQARLYRLRDGECLYEEQALEGPVWSLAFSPDGGTLAWGGEDHRIRLRRVADGRELRVLDQGHPVRALCFSPDGRHLFSGGPGGTPGKLRVWEAATGRASHAWDVGAVPKQIEFTADGRTLAVQVPGRPGSVWFLDAVTGTVKQKRPGVPAQADVRATAVAVAPGSRLVALGTADPAAVVVARVAADPARGWTFRLAPVRASAVVAAAFSPDGRYVAAGAADGVICLLHLTERGKLLEPPAPVAP